MFLYCIQLLSKRQWRKMSQQQRQKVLNVRFPEVPTHANGRSRCAPCCSPPAFTSHSRMSGALHIPELQREESPTQLGTHSGYGCSNWRALPNWFHSLLPWMCHYHRLSANKEYISIPFFMYKSPTGLQFYPKHICKKACNLLLLPSPSSFLLKSPHCPSPHQGGSEHSLEIQQEDKVFHREGGSQRGDVPSAEEEDAFVLPSPRQGRPHLMGCSASHGLYKSVQGQGKEKECTGHTLIKRWFV